MTMAAVGKLILLFAMLLMPFGMAPAAAAAPPQHMANMPMEHCPEQRSHHGAKGMFAECTMACSAALPAMDQSQSPAVPIARERVRPSLVQQLSDIHPDIATPPPKHA